MKKKIELVESDNCTSCLACMNICKHGAINISIDERGFTYPQVDDSKCIGCHSCEKVCPQINLSTNHDNDLPDFYAVKHKDDTVRGDSSSGGVFTWISDVIFMNEGVVYGVVLDENMQTVHIRATNRMDRNRMRGSKYVQSNIGYIYRQVKEDLLSHKMVLFTGTPCQCAGLLKYLDKLAEVEYLYTLDLICEGVPNQKIFNSFSEWVEKKYKSKIKEIYFRDKKKFVYKKEVIPSRRLIFKIEDKNKKDKLIYDYRLNRRYHDSFFSGYLQRDSCLRCKYTSMKRVTDFTCGDFFRYSKAFNDGKGISELLVNTKKAKDFFEKNKQSLQFVKCTKDEGFQPRLDTPVSTNIFMREMFWYLYRVGGFKLASIIIIPKADYVLIKKRLFKVLIQIKRVVWKL